MSIINQVVRGGGTTPTGSISITSNGTYDVTDKATAVVNVPTTAPAHYIEKTVDANGKLINGTKLINMTGITDIGNYVLYYEYGGSGFPANTVIDLSNLSEISGNYACSHTFDSSKNLVGADLSGLVIISGRGACDAMFASATITYIILSSLTTISGPSACANMFQSCEYLQDISFPSITENSFGSSGVFASMFRFVSNITIHFPSNVQSVVETLTGYSTTAPFGARSGTVLFDLPATYTLTGADTVTYTRNPKYDTITALAWKVGAYGATNFTPAYYTSGTTDPAVSDTIYSDSACTTAVTTISSIA